MIMKRSSDGDNDDDQRRPTTNGIALDSIRLIFAAHEIILYLIVVVSFHWVCLFILAKNVDRRKIKSLNTQIIDELVIIVWV